ncbi:MULTISPECIES: hypothetical protein [Pseudomonadaceae]|uniref:hypothetical protein n=1 Tax=Pseudomonadaceae TaxID=135621 RepID=UPI00103D67D6|nr:MULTISPECIES: hypothetical protein [Pseudomonadaceae]MBA1277135.1 hypothetical protein [Stutzerimonas stutzeri]MBC8650606.1 hypothetical protein [Pseudomonas sp. MT4]QXY91619.1 hypothetical protein GYM54_08435 [Pseudomonas sp. MTM4]TCD20577.1 hypothetical protein E0D86_14270 [Pseudomonas sp. IC_126]
MTDPLAKAGASAPPIIGSGCTQRYDPEHLGAELGTDFPGAEALWKQRIAAEVAASAAPPTE